MSAASDGENNMAYLWLDFIIISPEEDLPICTQLDGT